MVLDGARAAKPGRRLIAAYLRALGNGRAAASSSGCRSLHERVEPRLRTLVADALGVAPDALEQDTSLVHDLAADSLDLLDLAVQVEDEFGVAFPERELGVIATYGDLVAATVALVACSLRAEEPDLAAAPVEVRVGGSTAPRAVRVLGNTPYDRELLVETLRSVGPDEPVDVSRVGGGAADALERMLLRARFAGVDVRTPNGADAGRAHPADTPAAEAAEAARSWPASRLVAASLALMDALGGERDTSLRRVAARRTAGDELAVRRRTTDGCVLAFRGVVETYLDVLDDSRTILHAAARELGRLDLVRRAVDEHGMDADETTAAFDSIADALLCYVHALQSQAAWQRTRLPPRSIAPRASRPDEQQELRA